MRFLIAAFVSVALASQAMALSDKNSMAEFARASEQDRAAVIDATAKAAVEKSGGSLVQTDTVAELRRCFDGFTQPTEGSTPEEDAEIAANTPISAVAALCVAYKKAPQQ